MIKMQTIKKQNIKAIFFDLDDTLINSRKAESIAAGQFKNCFKEFEEIEKDEFEEIWHKIAMEQYAKYSKGEISYSQHRINRINDVFSKFNINRNDEDALKIFDIYLHRYEENWKLFDDAKDVLDNLKTKYKLGIITNGDGIQQRRKIDKTRIDKYFYQIIISSEIGYSKPKKEVFNIACNKIEELPENCIMIGDSFKLDIEGAKNVGLKAIWINRRDENIEYKNQIKELKELLKFDLL